MNNLIFPDAFSGPVTAFFTRKIPGADTVRIAGLFSLSAEHVFLPIQRHTDAVLVLESDMNPEVGDAVITQRTGVLIGVQVADCVPILIADPGRSAIGAVHAGWRGTAARILPKAIAMMEHRFGSSPEDMLLAIGPSIGGRCYEVGEEVTEAVCSATGAGGYCFTNAAGKACIDLSEANDLQALSVGVRKSNIWISGECTHCNHEKYHSYRYHKDYVGRQGAFIGML